MNLKDEVKDFPEEPGAYIIRSAGKVIYVGKSSSLRDRVMSYFNSGKATSLKTRSLREEADEVDYIVTESEVEALVLEENLIKEYRPKYNVLLRDNKRYPYLKITDEQYPQLEVTRKRGDEDGELFGPYTDAGAMRKTLDTIEKIFPIRDCSWSPEEGHRRPCLRYHIDLCPAPCAGKADRESYMETVDSIRDLLKGRIKEVKEELREKMERASKEKDFEKAAEWRDKIDALGKISRGQNVRLKNELDRDFIALERDDAKAEADRTRGRIQVFFVRTGRISGQDSFEVNFPPGEQDSSVLAGFLKKFYANRRVVPQEIYVEEKPEDEATIVEWLSELRSGRVEFVVPKRGQKKRVLEMAKRNARYGRDETAGSSGSEGKTPGEKGTEELKKVLGLPTAPRRIEGYDISNISGTDSVGSMVVFENGRASKDMYRKFKIEEDGPDDYAMLKKVLRRRFLHGSDLNSENREEEKDESFSVFPDLVLIDGGKGQLSASREVLASLNMDHIPIVGLAKEFERVFRPGRPEPVDFDRDSEGLKLLQRVRDEAHRFAVSYHRRLRQKRTVRSSLDAIRGVGSKRKKILLGTFDSVKGVSQASLAELKDVSGIPESVAERINEFFQED